MNASLSQNAAALNTTAAPSSHKAFEPDCPESVGYYGAYGGQFVPDDLRQVLDQVSAAFIHYKDDPDFCAELHALYTHYSGRPTPLFFCANLTKKLGGARIYLKREDLNHLGAHKINNALGQMLLAKRMGKTKVVAETGAGQHGVATAAAAALLGLECSIFMGEEDMRRQELNVIRMRMMGATVIPALSGQRTLKEAVDEALAAFVADPELFYVLGSAVGPHPYPAIVRHFQSVIGTEARRQMLDMTGKLPDAAIACVGGGSNAIGLFSAFLDDPSVRLIGAEPGGKSLARGGHAATLSQGTPGVLHGFRSYVLQDELGNVDPVHSISAGLDYPGVGPEHSHLKDTCRALYQPISDKDALDAFFALSRAEGIIPALESAHALACAIQLAPALQPDTSLLVCLSGRGDKDVDQVAELMRQGLV